MQLKSTAQQIFAILRGRNGPRTNGPNSKAGKNTPRMDTTWYGLSGIKPEKTLTERGVEKVNCLFLCASVLKGRDL